MISNTFRSSEDVPLTTTDAKGKEPRNSTTTTIISPLELEDGTGTGQLTRGSIVDAKDKLGPIKALLQTIPSDYFQCEEDTEVNKVLRRISLMETASAPLAGDPEEGKRWERLVAEIEDARKQFQRRDRSSTSPGTAQRDASVQALLFLNVLKLVTSRHSLAQSLAILEKSHEADSVNFYNSDSPWYVKDADHRSGNRGSCVEGTHTTILDEINRWANDPTARHPVYLLSSPPGTGKSTIAQTIAERLFKDGRLGASFFCSQEPKTKSDPVYIFTTIGFQLAYRYPEFRKTFARSFFGNEGGNRVIVSSLKNPAFSTVIVIDALDECGKEIPNILSVIQEIVSDNKNIKFFITARPGPQIRRKVRTLSTVETFALDKVGLSQVNEDIRQFFHHTLSKLYTPSKLEGGRRRELDNWPAPEALDQLCERAEGLFVYAKAMVSFIDRKFCDPRERLGLLLQSPESVVLREEIGLTEETTICSLYKTTLLKAFHRINLPNPKEDQKSRSIIGAVLLAENPISPPTIAKLLDITNSALSTRLGQFHNFLALQEGDSLLAPQPFHRAFLAFITDPEMCTDQRFYIPPPTHHRELLIGCLKLINDRLEASIPRLSDVVTDLEDRKSIDDRHTRDALKYACTSWHKHLAGTGQDGNPDEIIGHLRSFLEKISTWRTALDILHASEVVVDGERGLKEWLRKVGSSDALALLKNTSV